MNRATGECQCKFGYKISDEGKCKRFSFAFFNYDKETMSKYFCSVDCKKKVKFSDNADFVLKITTKDGSVNQLLDSEDFDHPSICGQFKANT